MAIRSLYMVFKGETGDKVTLTVNSVKNDLTKDEVEQFMDMLIAKNVLITKGGALVEKISAQVSEKNVDEFEVV